MEIYSIKIYSIVGTLFYKDRFYKDLFYDGFIHGDLVYKDLLYGVLFYEDPMCREPLRNSTGIYYRRDLTSPFYTRIYFIRILYYSNFKGSYKPLFHGDLLYKVLSYRHLFCQEIF